MMTGDHPETKGGEKPNQVCPILCQLGDTKLPWNEPAKTVRHFGTRITSRHETPSASLTVYGALRMGDGLHKKEGNLCWELAANSPCGFPLFNSKANPSPTTHSSEAENRTTFKRIKRIIINWRYLSFCWKNALYAP